MSLRINMNSAAAMAQRNLAARDSSLGRAIERLSSGYRVNRAADDPAALVVSENLRAQISGLGQAVSNTGRAVEMVRTADGALTEASSLLLSMRDRAVHAANTGVNDAVSIDADQTQIRSALASLDKLASYTTYQGKKLLDGSTSLTPTVLDSSVMVSATAGIAGSVFAGKSGAIDLTIGGSASRATLTGDVSYTSGTGAGDSVAGSGSIDINGVHIGDYTAADSKVSDVIRDINLATGTTGVSASYSGTHVVLTQNDYGSDHQVVLNDSSGILNSSSTIATGTDAQISDLSIGGMSVAVSGAQAFTVGKGNVLRNAAGDTITLAAGLSTGTKVDAAMIGSNFRQQSSTTIQLNNPAAVPEVHMSASGSVLSGLYGDMSAVVEKTWGSCALFLTPWPQVLNPNGNIGAVNLKVNDVTITPSTNTLNGVANAINTNPALAGKVSASVGPWGQGSSYWIILETPGTADGEYIKVDDAIGNVMGYSGTGNSTGLDVTLTPLTVGETPVSQSWGDTMRRMGASLAPGAVWYLSNNKGDYITVNSDYADEPLNSFATITRNTTTPPEQTSGLRLQLGANAGQVVDMSIRSIATDSLGTTAGGSVFSSLSEIDLAVDPQAAIKVIDEAISEISELRAGLGAFQKNTLESNTSSLSIARESLAATESVLRDTDIAAEMAQLTRDSIGEQVGTAMLTQANQMPQQILSLMKS